MALSCSIVVFNTQSITYETISGNKIHSCLTLVLTVKGADKSVLWMTLQLFVIFIEALDNVYDLLGNTIVPQNSPNHRSVHYVKSF